MQDHGHRGVERRVLGELLELSDGVNGSSHGDIRDALEDGFDNDGNTERLCCLTRCAQGFRQFLRCSCPYRLAAERLGDADMVDPVAVGLRRVEILEGQLDW